jgi:uncharacterized protein
MIHQRVAGMLQNSAFVRVAPFAAFMLFIAGEELLAYLQGQQFFDSAETLRLWLYVPKAATAGILLLLFRRHYAEIKLRDLLQIRSLLLSLSVGIVVFLLWINMDWTLASQEAPRGFNPGLLPEGPARWLMIAVRCLGAVIIVPIMEELFWRSFLLRYLINKDFMAVAVGRLTGFSLCATILLFGLEHHYFFAGVMAGALFTVVYTLTRSIGHCILSHAVANLCLAIYTLSTAQWRFW